MTDTELRLFNELQAKRIKQDEAFDFSMEGMFRGTEDIYPETAHFVYELLQNADDCEATEARFVISSERLVFIHNGKEHFTVTEDKEDVRPYGHINSITAYRSTKMGQKTQIGKFGIGFKSVYQYTEMPVIYDDDFKFYIKNRRIPYLISCDHPLRKDGETLFDLEFKNPTEGYEEILDRLKQLNNPVLFLPHIKRVSWQIDGFNQVYIYAKEETDIGEWEGTRGSFTRLNNNGRLEKLYVFRRTVSVPSENKDVEIRVGYFLDEEGNIDTRRKPNTYCFFSTEKKYFMCFIPHAPFLLTSNRADFIPNKVNDFLHEQVAYLAGDSLLYLRDIGLRNKRLLIDENLFKIIHDDNAPQHMKDYFIRIVRENDIILSRTKKYLRVSNAFRGDSEDIETLMSGEQLSSLYPYLNGEIDFVFNKKDRRGDIDMNLVKKIGVHVFDAECLSRLINADFLAKQPEQWVDRLYNYIEKHARQYWNKQDRKNTDVTGLILRTKSIIKTADGEWVPPYATITAERPSVYLPMEGGTPLRGKNYKFVDKGFYGRHESFFVGLGLHKPNIIDFIDSDILPKYRASNIYAEDSEIRQDLINLYNIWQKSNNEEKTKVRGILAEDYYLRATDGDYYTVDELCDDTPELHLFFRYEAFIDYGFYCDGSKDSMDREKMREFLLELGIRGGLRVSKITSCNSRIVSLYDISTRRWPEWFEDFEIDGYSKDDIDNKKSHIIWSFLCSQKRDDLEKYMKARCKGYRNYSQLLQVFECESSLLKCLQEDRWIFVDGKRCNPNQVTLNDFIRNGYENNSFLISHLKFKPEVVYVKSVAALGATKEQQENEAMGAFCRKEGYSQEEIKKLIENDKRIKQLIAQRSNDVEGFGDGPDVGASEEDQIESSATKETGTSKLDSRYAAASEEKDAEKRLEPKPKTRTRSVDLEDFIERQKRRVDAECDKEDAIQRMSELPEYIKEWFLCGLKYEYLNTEDTGREQISRSVSLSFTKVVPEHSNVYRFSNASKLIPRWLEEVDGDIKMVLKFKGRDEVTVNFAMACVQDFSLRLRAKGADEKLLSEIKWEDLTSANLDINNPRGLVKNLYEAFGQLPFEDDYNFRDNLKDNVKFIYGPPGTGKTTYITHKMSELMRSSEKCRILVLAPTNQACDVITLQLMEQNPDSYAQWLGRFVATNNEEIDMNGVVIDRDSTLYKNDCCCIVSTMARLSYDFFINEDDGRKCLKDIKWDYVVCDEGSMLSLPEIVYAIYKFSYDENVSFVPTPIVIAGDPKQLQPIDSSNVWGKRNVYSMVSLDSFEHPVTVPIQFEITSLETQHRSVPAIGELFSRYSYDGKLKHGRKETDLLKLDIPGLSLKPITYMPFLVDNYDDIYGAKRMSGSNVHIYSAIMTAELCKYISREYVKGNPAEGIKIGVICPYVAQVQLVQKMLDSFTDIAFSDKVEITAGTIHSFQGDQCNIIFALFNPPKGMASKRQASFEMLLNDDHLVNVAISRARDYLCIMVPSVDSYGWENLKDINRAAKILLSDGYSRKKDVGQIDCAKLEQLLFGHKNYLKNKSFITSHQMANVYTPTGYKYDIRIDESAIDIQIGEDVQRSQTVHREEPVRHSDNIQPPIVADVQDAGDIVESQFDGIDKAVLNGNEPEHVEIAVEQIVPPVQLNRKNESGKVSNKSNVVEKLFDAILEKDEEALETTLKSCTGQDVQTYRESVKELVATYLSGKDFWWFVKIALGVAPTFYRLPIIKALSETGTDRFVTSDVSSELEQIRAILFKDVDKVSQDIDFLYVFKEYYKEKIPNDVRRMSRNISQPDVFHKLFGLYHMYGEEKVDFLMDIRKEAALFALCQLFADKKVRDNMPQEDFNVFRYAAYRKSVSEKLNGDSDVERLASLIIRSTIQDISPQEQKFIDEIMEGGYEKFTSVLTKNEAKKSREETINKADDIIGKSCKVSILSISVYHYLVYFTTTGLKGLLPKQYAFRADYKEGEIVTVKVVGVNAKQKLFFVTQKYCTIDKILSVPLAKIGDKVVLEYKNEGKYCCVKSGCLKQIRPIVLNQKEHFDYKKKYPAIIVGRRSYFEYEMQLENTGSIIVKNIRLDKSADVALTTTTGGSIVKSIRLNKLAKELNVGMVKLVECLAKRGHHVDNNPNARLTPEQYEILVRTYGGN